MLTIPPNMTGRRVHNVGSWSSRRGDDSTRNLSVLCVHPDWCVFGQWWQWAYTMTMIIILLLLYSLSCMSFCSNPLRCGQLWTRSCRTCGTSVQQTFDCFHCPLSQAFPLGIMRTAGNNLVEAHCYGIRKGSGHLLSNHVAVCQMCHFLYGTRVPASPLSSTTELARIHPSWTLHRCS